MGARLGIDEVHGEVKPADKLQLIERLQKEGRPSPVAMMTRRPAALSAANEQRQLALGNTVLMQQGPRGARCPGPGWPPGEAPPGR